MIDYNSSAANSAQLKKKIFIPNPLNENVIKTNLLPYTGFHKETQSW